VADTDNSERVIYVTGKGGVGKSTLSHAVARAAAARGQRAVLVTLGESRTEVARSEDYQTIMLDGQRALGHLLERALLLRVLSERVLASRTFNAVAAAAPGLADLVMLSYIADLAAGRTDEDPCNLVVVDGYAAGHAQAMLAAPVTTADLLGRGPAADLIRRCRSLTTDRHRFRTLIVASPEELPVIEAAELWTVLARLDITRLPPAVNAIYPTLLNTPQAEFVRANGGAEARWYEATSREQRSWAKTFARRTNSTPLWFEHDFADGIVTTQDAARLLDAWT
jgi:anion-transporting  ArsA/GET3 family ATPase